MADGAFGLSKELAEETAPVWEKVKGLVTPLEWPEQAKLISEINALKKARDAVILAHNYMTPEIFHGVGDYVGDSLGLAKEAAKSAGVFWKQEAEILRQARAWRLELLDEVQDSVNTADIATKTTGLPEALIAERLLLEISARAKRMGL